MGRVWRSNGKVEGNVFERGCEGKTAYPTERSAEAGLRFFQKEGALRTNDGIGVYKCEFCPGWHFGH